MHIYYSVFIKRFSPNIAKHLYLCCLARAPAQDGDEELGDLYDELVVGVEPGQREVQQLQPQRHVVPVIVISVYLDNVDNAGVRTARCGDAVLVRVGDGPHGRGELLLARHHLLLGGEVAALPALPGPAHLQDRSCHKLSI